MKLVTYDRNDKYGEENRLGIALNNKVIDPQLVWKAFYIKEGHYNVCERAKSKISISLHENLKTKDNLLDLLKETIELASKLTKDGMQEMFVIGEIDSLKLNAPLDKISTYRDFYAHEKHVRTGFKKRNEEIPPAWFEIPAYYKGATAGFLGHMDEVIWPSYTDVLDYELELGMIIGKDGYNVKAEKAHKHIFGYTILNDISARDIQRKEMSIPGLLV